MRNALIKTYSGPPFIPLKMSNFPWASGSNLIQGLGSTQISPKRHLDRFRRFCTAHPWG